MDRVATLTPAGPECDTPPLERERTACYDIEKSYLRCTIFFKHRNLCQIIVINIVSELYCC